MGQCNFQKAPPLLWALILWAFCLEVAALRAEDAGDLGMFLEPKHFAPDIYHMVPGAKKTVLVPARLTKYGSVDSFTEEDWKREGLDLPTLQVQALQLASRLNQEVEVTYEKDSKGVIQYAYIESENPFLSSIIFPKKDGKNEFLQRFEKIFGKEVLVVVPERHILYVFPRYTPAIQEFGPSLAQKYHDAPLKGSQEIFLVTETTCEVVGMIEQ